jgi:hypothetical protein
VDVRFVVNEENKHVRRTKFSTYKEWALSIPIRGVDISAMFDQTAQRLFKLLDLFDRRILTNHKVQRLSAVCGSRRHIGSVRY